MKQSTIFLILLLVLDMLTSIYMLEYIPNTLEVNPLLNQFNNVILAVIVSHILAIFLVWAIDSHMMNIKGKDKIRLEIFMSLVVFFYFAVVLFNFLNIILNHYNMM